MCGRGTLSWRRRNDLSSITADAIAVCYTDDLMVGFQHRTDAERSLREFWEILGFSFMKLGRTYTKEPREVARAAETC
jgi:hypothetical protein